MPQPDEVRASMAAVAARVARIAAAIMAVKAAMAESATVGTVGAVVRMEAAAVVATSNPCGGRACALGRWWPRRSSSATATSTMSTT